MTFADLVSVLRRFWPLVLGVFATTVVLAALFLYLPTERFESTSSVVVQPSSAQSLSFGATEAVQYLLPPIVKRAGSEEFRIAIRHRARVPRDVPLDLTVENDAGTAIVQLTASSTRPQTARLGASWAALEVIRRPLSTYVIVTALEQATAPESTRSQRATPVLLGATVLGLILGLFAALAANVARRRLPAAREVASAHGLLLLGEIPHRRRLPPRARDLFAYEEHVEVRAAFERLAAVIQTAEGRAPMIAVTSWAEGEGKTTVTANVAYALASFGYQVTAVDFDLRHPALHEALGVELSPGVSDYDGDAAAQPTDLAGLEVIAGGTPDEHPVKILRWSVATIRSAVAERIIVADTPPLFAPETAMVAARVDAVVIVVDARARRPADFERAIDDLRRSGARVLGMVVNHARLPRSGRVPGAYYAGRSPAGSAPDIRAPEERVPDEPQPDDARLS